MRQRYVHGYDSKEAGRLQDQAATLAELLHSDTVYPAGSWVLEAGCGVGAQTVSIARNSPGARFAAVDISPVSLAESEIPAAKAGLTNVSFLCGDLFGLPFSLSAFDRGIADLYRTAASDGVFCYTFFKAVAQ